MGVVLLFTHEISFSCGGVLLRCGTRELLVVSLHIRQIESEYQHQPCCGDHDCAARGERCARLDWSVGGKRRAETVTARRPHSSRLGQTRYRVVATAVVNSQALAVRSLDGLFGVSQQLLC